MSWVEPANDVEAGASVDVHDNVLQPLGDARQREALGRNVSDVKPKTWRIRSLCQQRRSEVRQGMEGLSVGYCFEEN